MFDLRSYRDACSELHVSEEKMEELIAMTTNRASKQKIRYPLRMGAVVAATMALLTIGASAAANPEAAQELLYHITSVIQVGQFRQDMTTDAGVQLTSYTMPDIHVEDRNGRAILLVDGQETDITDSLAQEGRYVYEYTDEGILLTATVEGTAQDWKLSVDVTAPEEGSVLYSYITDSSGAASSIGVNEYQIDDGGDNETSVSISVSDKNAGETLPGAE